MRMQAIQPTRHGTYHDSAQHPHHSPHVLSCSRRLVVAQHPFQIPTLTVIAARSWPRRAGQSVKMIVEPTWRVHVGTWLRFFVGNRLGPYHAMPQHVINGILNLADGQRDTALNTRCDTSTPQLTHSRSYCHGVLCYVCCSVSSDDVLFDMGCGDGRLLIEAAKQRRVRQAVGIELNPTLARLAEQNIRAFTALAPPSQLSVQHCDARTADVSPATVVTLYLSHRGNRQLRQLLSTQLLRQPRCRVASFCFDMDGWTPARRSTVSGIPLYLYNSHSIGERARREAG